MWSASATANLGDALYLLALPLLALRLHASPGEVAAVTVLLTLAWPVLGLPAGLLADRLDRRRLVVAVNVGRVGVLGALTLGAATGSVSLAWVYAAAFLLGLGETIVDSSLAALIPSTVRDQQLLGRANARLELAINVTNQFVGPPLAGLLAVAGLVWVTGASSLLYLATLPMLALMSGRYRAASTGAPESLLAAVTAGLRYTWRHSLLRTLTLLTASMNIFWAAWTAVLVVYVVAPGPVGLSPAGYGLLLTAMALGAVAGSALVEPLRRWLGDRQLLALDIVGTVVLVGTPAVTTNPVAIGAAMFLGGAGSAVWRVIVAVVRQRVTPADLLARVYSASRVISWGVLPAGAALGGLLAEVYGVRAVFVVGGVASLALLVAYALTIRPPMLDVAGPATPRDS